MGREYKKERMDGPDLLRCVAMMMIVVLHFLGKGGLLPYWEVGGTITKTRAIADLLESFAIIGVNIYMLISGYFLPASHFRLSRLITLYVQLWIYSVGVAGLCVATGLVSAETLTTHDILVLVLPVSMEHYWFLTAYLFLYLLLPILNVAVEKMTKEQLLWTTLFLLFVHSGLKSLLLVRLDTDRGGYHFLWYLIVYLIAAYIRKYQPAFFQSKVRCAVLWLMGSLGVFAERMLFGIVYSRKGSLGQMLTVPLEYNHLLVLAASLGLFGLLLHVRLPRVLGGITRFLAPYTLGVYLLHENIFLRYHWTTWFRTETITTVPQLLARTVLAMILVFAAGILVDMIRKVLQDGLGRFLLLLSPVKKLWEWICRIDSLFGVNYEKVEK